MIAPEAFRRRKKPPPPSKGSATEQEPEQEPEVAEVNERRPGWHTVRTLLLGTLDEDSPLALLAGHADVLGIIWRLVTYSWQREQTEAAHLQGRLPPNTRGVREAKKAARDIERERNGLERREKKLMGDIKQAAKAGKVDAAKSMARDLERTRGHLKRLLKMKAHVEALEATQPLATQPLDTQPLATQPARHAAEGRWLGPTTSDETSDDSSMRMDMQRLSLADEA